MSLLWLLLFSSGTAAIKLSRDGRYSGVTLVIDENIRGQDCQVFTDNIKNVLEEMSVTVGRSLDWQIVPEHFIVVLPSEWNSSSCGQTISQARGDTRYRQADMVISQNTPVTAPATLHSRGCGVSGESLQIPSSWLSQAATNFTAAGRLLAWEFLKLRFGVFSQSGFLGDPIYPSKDSTCYPVIDPDCEESLPSKQDDLCRGRSVREVIEDSLDFSRVRRQINTPCEDCFTPRIDFVQKHQEQFIILLDTSATMDNDDGWKFLAKAVKKMILYDLPDKARVGLVTFNEASKVEAELTELSARTRPGLADVVPDKYRLSASREACVECGLRRVIRTTETLSSLSETNVILITANNSLGEAVSEDILSYLDQHQVKVSTVLLSDKSVYYYDKLGSLSNGKVSMVDNRQGPISRYVELMAALQYVTGQLKMLHSQLVDISPEEATVSTGQFAVPEESELYVVVSDVYSHLVQSVSLSQQTGARHGPYHTLSRGRAGVNMLSLYRAPALLPGPGWQYRVSWFSPLTSGSVQAGLVVEGPPGYSVKMWTSSVQLTDQVTAQSPLELFVAPVQLSSGLPVLRARVTVTCRLVSSDVTSRHCGQQDLGDDGTGADITGEDGVYSGHWLHYPGTGRYQFTVTVTDNQGEAFVVEPGESQQQQEECCGSKMSLFGKRLTKCGEFQLRTPGSALHLIQVPPLSDVDTFPPGRIRDLQLRTGTDQQQVLAVFSAPGDDYNQGGAALYKLLVSRNRSELQSSAGLFAQSLAEFTAEEEAGEEVNFMFDFGLYNEDIFVGVVAMDESGNVGQMSNIVMVHISSMEPEQLAGSVSEDVTMTRSEDWSLSLALGGAIVFLASFLALGVLYFVKVVKSRKSVASSIHDGVMSDTETNSNMSASSQSNTMSKSLAESTPTFWSASFLLSTHENVARRISTPICQTLPPIQERYSQEYRQKTDGFGLTNPGYRDPGIFHQRHVSLV